MEGILGRSSEMWGVAAGLLALAVVAGLVVDQLLYRYIRSRAEASRSSAGLQLAKGVHWLPTSLGLLVGLSLAISRLELEGTAARWANQGVRLLGIVLVTAFAARILGRVVRAVTQREDTPLPSGSIFVNLVRGLVWALGAVSVLATLGISVAPLVTALGVTGLAVGLALQPTLENVFSGVQLLASRQIQPGDFIRLETGEEGTVLDVTWRNTTVRRPSNDVVIVPNSVLARATVTNFTSEDPEYVLLVPVSVASAGDPEAVERAAMRVATEVVAEVDGAVRDAEPAVSFAELTPPAAVLHVTIRCTSYQERVGVRHEFIRRLAKRFADEGIEAPPVAMPRASAQKR